MLGFILTLALQASPPTYCPRIVMVNINLGHSVDRGVLKRTRRHCGRLYSKSPCLIKLEQTRRGAFQAICGTRRVLEKDDGDVAIDLMADADLEDEFLPNCSAAIFERMPLDASKDVPDLRLGQAYLFCQDTEIARADSSALNLQDRR
jgi:hypothetical protein